MLFPWAILWAIGVKFQIAMETAQCERGVLPRRQYNGGEGCYHGDSTVGERGVTMETVQWGRVVLTMEAVQWGRGVYIMETKQCEKGVLPWTKNILKNWKKNVVQKLKGMVGIYPCVARMTASYYRFIIIAVFAVEQDGVLSAVYFSNICLSFYGM